MGDICMRGGNVAQRLTHRAVPCCCKSKVHGSAPNLPDIGHSAAPLRLIVPVGVINGNAN